MIRVGITQGDFNGVGYEVIAKSLSDPTVVELYTPVVFGSRKLLQSAFEQFAETVPQLRKIKDASEAVDGAVNVVDVTPNYRLSVGSPTEESGRAAFDALEAAVAALKEGTVDVLVTAPICKSNIQNESFSFPGHTEYLENRLGEELKARMILFSDAIRVMLVTTHLPVKDVAQAITEEKILETIDDFNQTLRQDFGILRPKIAVLSLNPHCGDSGLLGDEEQRIISPAIEKSMEKGVLAFGPFAADGFFGSDAYRKFDGIVAMYHDQGLAPFKAIARTNGVNFTACLPYVRTSPDHGTAFDIAWSGNADPTSMREAIYAAIDIYRNRCRHLRASANPLRKTRMEKGADKNVDLSKEDSTL